MTPDQPHALQIRRLRTAANVFELDSVLREIVAADHVNEAVIKLLKEKIAAGYAPQDSTLTDLFLRTRDVDLHELIRQRLNKLHWECLCKLYEAEIGDPQIEEILSEKIYKSALSSTDASRSIIAKSMRLVGTTGVLDTLRSIEEELRDRSMSGAAFGGNLPMPERILVKSDVAFYRLIKEAIEDVTRRAAPPLSHPEQVLPTGSAGLISGTQEQVDFIRAAAASGENHNFEFKETFSLNVKSGSREKDPKIQHSALKTIAGFMNADGGTLLVGVSDAGEILGVDREIQLFHQGSPDKFLLNFVNELRSKIGNHVFSHLKFDLAKVDGVPVLVCQCSPGREPCFLGASHEFWVRTNPATLELKGREMVSYIETRFHS